MAIQYSADELLSNPQLMQEYVNDTTTLLQELQAGTAAESGASVTYSDTAPSNPSQGDQWFHSDDADLNLYVYESQSGAWIDTSPGGGGGGGRAVTVLDSDVLISDPTPGGLYYIATVPHFRAYLSGGDLVPACTGRDDDTLHYTTGADIGLENTPFKTVSPNISFIMADANCSSASRRNYTVRGTAKAGHFQNNNYIDVTPNTQAADVGKFAWLVLGAGQNNAAAVGDVFAYVNSTVGWRKVASSTSAIWL